MTVTSPKWLEEHAVDEGQLVDWANVMLGWAGEYPWQPSAWELALIRLLSVSDTDNSETLFKAFPAAVAAYVIWKEGDREELRRIAGQKSPGPVK